MTARDMDRVSQIIAFEAGTMSDDDMVAFFQELIDDGSAWTLQGHYGRTAKALIDSGLCHERGNE
jgi:hypothetical protein